jgi:trans-aconitate methyltransferase
MNMSKLDKSLSAYSTDVLYYFDEEILLNWYSKRIADKFARDVSVLDLGLGHGIVANTFSKHFEDYTILEGSQKIIDKYRAEFPNSTANIVNTFFENYNTDRQYDLIIMGFILEHVENPVQIMSDYKKFLRSRNLHRGIGGGGNMILAVPNAEAMNRRLGYYAGFLDDITKLSGYDQELGHLRYYTVNTFTEDIMAANLKIKNMEGIYLKPFTTKQIVSLNFDKKILDALCMLGVEYPELSLGIMAECEI